MKITGILKKSDIARLVICKYLTEEEGTEDGRPYKKISHLIGSVSSGVPDLGERHREHLLEPLKEES